MHGKRTVKQKDLHINHLTAQEIEGYVTEKLSDAEMHRVEKHMLECDFCADAVQGLEGLNQQFGFKDDVEILKTRVEHLAAKTTKNGKNKFVWLAAASILVLFGFLGYYFVDSNTTTNARLEVAEQKDTLVQPPVESIKDTANAQIPETSETTSKVHSFLIADSRKPQQENTTKDLKEEVLLDQTFEFNIAEKADAVALNEEVISVGNTLNFSSATALNTTVEPLVSESLKLDTEKSLPTQITLAKTTNQQAGNVIKTNEEVQEKKVIVAQSEAEPSSNELSQITNKPKPEIGWEAYKNYLTSNKIKPAEALKNNISGTVILEFSTNKKGEPTKIKVAQTLGFGCDEEAIRLLKSGGNWINPNNQNITLRVDF